MNKAIKIRTDLCQDNEKWFAIYCKYKCEKLVVDRISKKGIEAYVPIISETKRYTRKIKTFHKPLFNCYAFVKIKEQDYLKVLETENVLHFVKISRELISIPEAEINILKRVVGECNDIELGTEFCAGMEVEVIAGNLTGLKGMLLEMKSKKNFIVVLDKIGFQLSIQISAELLRPLNNYKMSLA